MTIQHAVPQIAAYSPTVSCRADTYEWISDPHQWQAHLLEMQRPVFAANRSSIFNIKISVPRQCGLRTYVESLKAYFPHRKITLVCMRNSNLGYTATGEDEIVFYDSSSPTPVPENIVWNQVVYVQWEMLPQEDAMPH